MNASCIGYLDLISEIEFTNAKANPMSEPQVANSILKKKIKKAASDS